MWFWRCCLVTSLGSRGTGWVVGWVAVGVIGGGAATVEPEEGLVEVSPPVVPLSSQPTDRRAVRSKVKIGVRMSILS